jgi:hypothetical protein
MEKKLTVIENWSKYVRCFIANPCMRKRTAAARAVCAIANCVSNFQIMNKVGLASFKGLS